MACSSPHPFRDPLKTASAWKVSDYLTYLCPNPQCCTPGFAGHPPLGVSAFRTEPSSSHRQEGGKDGGIRAPLVFGFLIWICQYPGAGGGGGGHRTGSTKDSIMLGQN